MEMRRKAIALGLILGAIAIPMAAPGGAGAVTAANGFKAA
jgi:hypothetical protein